MRVRRANGWKGFNTEFPENTEMARRSKAEDENVARGEWRRGVEREAKMGANYQETG